MSSLPRPIGILGGTFDPIHLAHLQIATQVYRLIHCQEVRLIPCYQPVHRPTPLANPKDRLNMIKLAIKNQKGVTLDDREIRRGGPSYMIDTLISIRKEVATSPLLLIMATDAFAGFHRWRRWQEIPEYSHILIVNRPEHPLISLPPELTQLLQQREVKDATMLAKKPNGYILFIDIPRLPISATEIRDQIAAGKEPKDLLPSQVWEYIQAHKLYHNSMNST